MTSITYSAPGKVIISGEHSVVYGKPALVCAIDKRLSITFSPSQKTEHKDSIFPILEKSVVDFLNKKKEPFKKAGYTYSVRSSIPMGRGLGSSAAYCACIAAGLLELFTGREWSKDDINVCSYQMEKYFHKNSSGVDTTTSVMGGLIYYRKEFEFLKTISSLTIKIPKNIIDSLLLIDTGTPTETTGEMVQSVGVLYNEDSDKMESILNEIEKTTKRIIVSLMKEDSSFLKDNIQSNQVLLEKIGVVSDKTKRLLFQLQNVGVGKITGAGGKKDASGYVLFYTEKMDECIKKLNEMDISHMSFLPSYSGLVREGDNKQS